VTGDRLSKTEVSSRLPIHAAADRAGAELAGDQSTPLVVREQAGIGDTRPKVILRMVDAKDGREGNGLPDVSRP
jgi:hypothetical protein